MFEKISDCEILSNGVKMPCIGFGTWKSKNGDIAENSVAEAIRLGYRHIDTAAAYGNEESVGAGIRRSGISREELFVTTKHWVTERGYEKTIKAFENSLIKLGLDYLDLYLIHWPCVEKISTQWEEINADTWRGFEKLYNDGKIRAIGVSNFLPSHLESLKSRCNIKPIVNQIEFHPGYTEKELVDYCRSENIAIQAWSPLGCGAILNNDLICKIASKYNKTAAQLCIRFALQSGIIPLPKSVTPERIAENADVFDFNISPEDMELINKMPITGYSGFYPEDAPADD